MEINTKAYIEAGYVVDVTVPVEVSNPTFDNNVEKFDSDQFTFDNEIT